MFLTIILVNTVFSRAKIDSTIRDIKTASIGGVKFTAVLKVMPSEQAIFIKNESNHKTIKIGDRSLESAGISGIDFIDFNQDGYKDILIDYYTNVPGIQDLLLYDKNHKTFVKVKNFAQYPDAIHIHYSKYFYSYHRSGCADWDWDSDLFKIVNFKVVKIATISGRGCDRDDPDDKEETGVFIYKVKDAKGKLIKKLPITVIEKYKDWKWGFIRDYWKRHYLFFAQP